MFALAHAHAKGHVRTGFESLPPFSAKTKNPPNGGLFVLEKVLRFDRKPLRGVHRLFRGVHFLLGGCKWSGGCILNVWGEASRQNPRSTKSFTSAL